MLCVTRKATSKPDNLRSYKTTAPSEENYDCMLYEAASATAAAPMYFKGVKFTTQGENWCDGGLRRNNPIMEVMNEVQREPGFRNRKVGCILSIGTGAPSISHISSGLASFLQGAVKMMTNSEDIANDFAATDEAKALAAGKRYFRFSIPQGMEELELDECKEKDLERMRALASNYLRIHCSAEILQCARSLHKPDESRE